MNAKMPGPWAELPFLLAGACIPVFDVFAVSMILPTIRGALGGDAVQTQLVVSAFSAVYAVVLITGSRLGDLFGRRRLFVTGILGFTVASVLAALSPNLWTLIAARAVQGAAAALFAPQVLASIQALFGPAERPRAIGGLGRSFSIASILGFVAGGLLIAWHPLGLTWQLTFLAYVPVGLAVAVGGLLVPESKNPHAQGLDPVGVVLLAVALGLLVIPLTLGRAAGWPWWSWTLLAVAPGAWLAFILWQSRLAARGGSPLVSLELFRDGAFVKGLVLSFVLYVCYAFLFCFALFLRSSRHLSDLELGLANLPVGWGFLAVSFFFARLWQWLGNRILVLGFGLLTLGWLSMLGSVLAGGSSVDLWGDAGLFVVGLGNGIVLPSLMRVVTGAMEPRHAGQAAGVLLSVQQMGSSLGVVILGGVYFNGAALHPEAGMGLALAAVVILGTAAALLSASLVAKPNAAVQIVTP